MATRKWTRYSLPGASSFFNARPVSIAKDTALVNAVVANYAEARRNSLCLPFNTPYVQTVAIDAQVGWQLLFRLPIGDRILPGFWLDNWMYCHVQTAGETNQVFLSYTIGDSTAYSTVDSNSDSWIETRNEIYPQTMGAKWLEVRAKTFGANILYVKGISGYQDSETPATWTDLSGAQCKVGDDDFACDALQYKLLRDNTDYVRKAKLPRGQVYSHWFFLWGTGSTSFAEVGRYKVAKRRNTATVRIGVLYQTAAAGACEIKTTLGGTAQTTACAAATTAAWKWLTDYTYLGAAILAESEAELLIEARDSSGAAVEVHVIDVLVTEDAIAVRIACTVPDTVDTLPRKVIKSSTADNMRTTLHHLGSSGGGAQQIMCADHRWTEIVNGSGAMNCTDTAFDKADHAGGSSVVAKIPLYPSTGSVRLMVRLGYQTSEGMLYAKQIEFQVTDDLATLGTYDDIGPVKGSGPYVFLNPVTDGNDVGHPELGQLAEVACEMDIPAAHWDDDKAAPLWVVVMAITGNAVEYVIPRYLEVHEIALTEDEFP